MTIIINLHTCSADTNNDKVTKFNNLKTFAIQYKAKLLSIKDQTRIFFN